MGTFILTFIPLIPNQSSLLGMLNIDIRILMLFVRLYPFCLLGMLNIDIRIPISFSLFNIFCLLGMLNIDIRIQTI